MSEPPVQLRIGFAVPERPARVRLQLNGMQVLAASSDGDDSLVHQHFAAVGISVSLDGRRGPHFPVRELPRVNSLPAQVQLDAYEQDMRTLLAVARYSRPGVPPALVRLDTADTLNVAWQDVNGSWNEPLSLSAAPALIAMGVPVVAPDGTWEALLQASSLPSVIANARVNLDGFIEIRAAAPQRLELAPIEALFRLDESTFGAPLASVEQVRAIPGVLWQGETPAAPPTRTPRPESTGMTAEGVHLLESMLPGLSVTRGRVVRCAQRHTRSALALAIVESMDAYPLLVLTQASHVWLWQLALDRAGLNNSLVNPAVGVLVTTFEQFSRAAPRFAPAAIVFDGIDHLEPSGLHLLKPLHSLDGLSGAVRIACVDELPQSVDLQLEIMSLVRPGEFRSGVPAAVRYPPDARKRAAAHVQSYVESVGGTLTNLGQRCQVEVLGVPDSLKADLDRATASADPLLDRAESCLRAISGGSAESVSPKVTAAFQYLQEASVAGRRAVVVTAHERTALMVWSLGARLGVQMYRPGEYPEAPLAVLVVGKGHPDVSQYDTVVWVDYPLSLHAADRSATDSGRGQARVVLLHLDHPVEDRMASIAAARRENSDTHGVSPIGPSGIGTVEAAYLLGE